MTDEEQEINKLDKLQEMCLDSNKTYDTQFFYFNASCITVSLVILNKTIQPSFNCWIAPIQTLLILSIVCSSVSIIYLLKTYKRTSTFAHNILQGKPSIEYNHYVLHHEKDDKNARKYFYCGIIILLASVVLGVILLDFKNYDTIKTQQVLS
ncbi:MAG: membrane glycosyltransferase [Candidatus Deianiraeaceae bacterium]|jgi:membrane glycosyltransferase